MMPDERRSRAIRGAGTGAGEAADTPASPDLSETAALLHELLIQVVALREYAAHYLAAWLDRARVRARRAVLRLLAAAAGAIAALGLLVAAGVFVVRGLAGGLAAGLGVPGWAGDLLAGVLVLGMVGGSAVAGVRRARAAALHARAESYARRKKRQQARVGRDAERAAQEAA